MSIDPINATKAINNSYLSYLSTTFYLSDAKMRKAFLDELCEDNRFVKGPILEVTPPFKKGASLYELIDEEVLTKSLKGLDSEYLPLGRRLYKHQEMAIRKIAHENRNVVVATGTGSGKTEIFMLPILNYLLKQNEDNTLTPGVRALLLYPMNALANDQLARLRNVLKNRPEILFGRYTGETETETSAAIEAYRKMHKCDPLPNELLSRKQMWQTPPHILLTNYAMLEYLLLRPQDNVFFDGEHADYWKFLILDEVHSYNGAKGIEIAMLLRRLKDRVVRSEPGKISCIATSATLGRGDEDYNAVATFASNLFGESFANSDIVGATREKISLQFEPWGRPDKQLYEKWQSIIYQKIDNKSKKEQLIEFGRKYGVPANILFEAEGSYGRDGNIFAFLYEVLKGDQNLIDLQFNLEEPCYLGDIAKEIFNDNDSETDANKVAVALVDLAVKAKHRQADQALLPARYHVFVRAIEGAYLSLGPQVQLFLNRHEKALQDGKEYKVFELAVCRGCGIHYYVGEMDYSSDGKYFKQPKDKLSDLVYLLPVSAKLIDHPDEDEEVLTEQSLSSIEMPMYKLCLCCGKLDKNSVVNFNCNCDKPEVMEFHMAPSNNGKVAKCYVCGKFSPHGLVKRFTVGTDAAASVLATSLYQKISPKTEEVGRNIEHDEDDEWSSVNPSSELQNQFAHEAGRKLLIFSDSRQDAAFFAPYFNRTYMQILRRNLIIRVLWENKHDALENDWHVQDLVAPLLKKVQEIKLFTGMSSQEKINEIWKWLFYELIGVDRRLGLEGLGLVGFSLVKPERWSAPQALKRAPWNLSDDEVWTLIAILLDTLRYKGVVQFPEYVDPTDDFFQPRNREYFIRGRQAALDKGIISWNSASSRLNSRLDFIKRLAAKIDKNITDEDCRVVQSRIWDKVLALESNQGYWREYFDHQQIRNEGVAYRLKNNNWKLQPGIINENISWYQCDKCFDITLNNLQGICPKYRCEGTLKLSEPSSVLRDNHYHKLYLETLPLAAKAEEHTAQLTSPAASRLQSDFINGETNILSCSTTFELGVDVGELEAVFMRNVPPSAANYMQRAGRAGRRTDATAFALTFAQRRSHDLNHFAEPWRMVGGEVGVPHVAITNEKIVRRHVFAVVMAAFWKIYPDCFGTVDTFIMQSTAGPDLLRDFLLKKPNHIIEALQRIVPFEMQETLEINNWGWIDNLLNEEKGLLSMAEAEIKNDIYQLQLVRDDLIAKQKKSDSILRLINTIKRKPLIDFLSSRSVIPKYGFPVDVVELQLLQHSEAARRLQLQRDLRIALSEYAPSSEVIAGGKLWTSRYIRRSPRLRGSGDWEWERFRYAICDYCQSYKSIRAEGDQQLEHCFNCQKDLEGKNRGVFINPAFGFDASRETPTTPGEQRPEKTYSTRIYYSGDAVPKDRSFLKLNNVDLYATPATHGKMAIINNAGHRQFKICVRCGYALIGDEITPESHLNPWGGECHGTLKRHSLGHEFETDLVQLVFRNYQNEDQGFWFSLLYALLEGCSEALEIERQDLDGVLYPISGNPATPAIVIFDDVPGGAGHAHRIADLDNLKLVLFNTLKRMQRCECGGNDAEASCYGCLRHYRNQFCHDQLNRRKVIDFLIEILNESDI